MTKAITSPVFHKSSFAGNICYYPYQEGCSSPESIASLKDAVLSLGAGQMVFPDDWEYALVKKNDGYYPLPLLFTDKAEKDLGKAQMEDLRKAVKYWAHDMSRVEKAYILLKKALMTNKPIYYPLNVDKDNEVKALRSVDICENGDVLMLSLSDPDKQYPITIEFITVGENFGLVDRNQDGPSN